MRDLEMGDFLSFSEDCGTFPWHGSLGKWHTGGLQPRSYGANPMYFTHILKSEKDGKLYIGSTGSLERRFGRIWCRQGALDTSQATAYASIYRRIWNKAGSATQRIVFQERRKSEKAIWGVNKGSVVLMVKHRSPKPRFLVRVQAGPQRSPTPQLRGGS